MFHCFKIGEGCIDIVSFWAASPENISAVISQMIPKPCFLEQIE